MSQTLLWECHLVVGKAFPWSGTWHLLHERIEWHSALEADTWLAARHLARCWRPKPAYNWKVKEQYWESFCLFDWTLVSGKSARGRLIDRMRMLLKLLDWFRMVSGKLSCHSTSSWRSSWRGSRCHNSRIIVTAGCLPCQCNLARWNHLSPPRLDRCGQQ